MIDITMPAVVRPEIIRRTLSSFCDNMLKERNEYRLILNVDPIGENYKQNEIYKIALKYFDNIEVNYPETPSFTKAVYWCWSQVKSDYVFHLEDDWWLCRPCNIYQMIYILNQNPTLASLRLNKERTKGFKEGQKLGFVSHPKISLNPTLFRGDFIKGVYGLMDLTLNPEKQMRSNKTPRGKFILQWTHGIYISESYLNMVDDIGRDWMAKTKFFKKTGFMNWEVKS